MQLVRERATGATAVYSPDMVRLGSVDELGFDPLVGHIDAVVNESGDGIHIRHFGPKEAAQV